MAALAGCQSLRTAATADADLAARARLLRIEDTRRDEPAYLASLLGAESAPLRAAAARTAGRLGGSTHRVALRALAADPSDVVAANALFALGLLKDTLSATIAERSMTRAPSVAVQGAWLLGELGGAGVESLVRVLAQPALPSEVRGAALLAAARARPLPAASIIPWIRSADTAVAWRAAYALARGRSAAGVRPLIALTTAASPAVRQQVARALARPATGDSLAETSFAALGLLVADADAQVRVNAVRSIATHGPRGAAAVTAALGDRDAAVRLAAAQSLEPVLDTSAAAWRAAFGRDTTFVVQRAVADGAARRGVRLWDGWITSGDWERRAAAAELDGSGPAGPAFRRLVPKLADGDGRVRAAAITAVARLSDSAETREPARTVLRESLRDDDVGVRTAALSGLARSRSADDLELALDSYVRSRDDRDADARLAFWAFADSALRRAPAVSAAVEARLAALPRPADPLERAAASRIPRFAGWADPSGVPRPAEWYEARAREAAGTPRRAIIETDRGAIEVALHGDDAPLTVHNFATLAQAGYFDGQRFHRVVPNFVAQAGDPRGDGSGGPGYAIRDEINPHRYLRGTMGMALSGPHTGGSQFFLTHSPQPHLDGGYTVFGQLIAGGEVLDRIVQGDRIVRVTIR